MEDLTLHSDLYNNLKFNMHKLLLEIPENDSEWLSSIFGASEKETRQLLDKFSETTNRQAEELKKKIALPAVHGRKTVAFIGDSITSDRESYLNILKKLYENNKEIKFIDAAISGDKSDDSKMKLYYRVMNQKPDIVHILIGTNDMRENMDENCGSCISLNEYADNLEYMIKTLKSSCIKIVISTISPTRNEGIQKRFPEDHWKYTYSNLEEVNRIIEYIAEKYKLKLNDMRPIYSKFESESILLMDGLHLNELGQQLLAQHVLLSLEEYL